MEGVLPSCAEGCKPPLLFEPRIDGLESLGLHCQESLVTVDDEGCYFL